MVFTPKKDECVGFPLRSTQPTRATYLQPNQSIVMKFNRFLKILFFLLPMAWIALFFLEVFFWNPNRNHGNSFFEILYILPFFVIFAVYNYLKERKRVFLFAMVVNVLTGMFFYFVDKYNVMIDSSTWEDRGMPSRFSQKGIAISVKEESKQQ